MKLNVIIPTRKSYSEIYSLLHSLILKDFINKVIIIGDSGNFHSDSKIKGIYNKSQGKLFFMDNKKLKKFKSLAEIRGINLSKREWNIGIKRNIGIILSSAFSDQCSHTMFLDDDISIKKIYNKNLANSSFLGRIKIYGCPDLSRLEWIELYLKLRNPKEEPLNEYIEEIYNELGIKACYLLSKYTNLHLTGEYKEISPELPDRGELSGGSFLCSNDLLSLGFFSNWFDEDWLWFNFIRRKAKITNTFSRFEVGHDSSKKDVLKLKDLIFEENGKILTETLKEESRLNKLSSIISRKISLRRNLISDLSNRFKSLKNKTNLDKYVINRLGQLYIYLNNVSISEYLEQILDFFTLSNYLKSNMDNIVEDILNSKDG